MRSAPFAHHTIMHISASSRPCPRSRCIFMKLMVYAVLSIISHRRAFTAVSNRLFGNSVHAISKSIVRNPDYSLTPRFDNFKCSMKEPHFQWLATRPPIIFEGDCHAFLLTFFCAHLFVAQWWLEIAFIKTLRSCCHIDDLFSSRNNLW